MAKAGLDTKGKPRVPLLSTTRVWLRIWPNDLDFNLHVNNGRYLTLADIGRMHWFARTGMWAVAREEKALPVVGDAIAKFRREVRGFQKFCIESRMLGWDHRWGFLEHRFVREGRVVGVVAIRGVFKGPAGAVEPCVLLAKLGVNVESPPLPEWIVDWSRGCDALSQLLREEEQVRGHRQKSEEPRAQREEN
jgi:acyl-CoA thioesterase FadM